jgi:predicted ester cyclase
MVLVGIWRGVEQIDGLPCPATSCPPDDLHAIIGDLLQALDAAFPDFKANVWSEYDSPGCSVREIAVQGTHKGEWCGVAGTGRRVKFYACMLYLFGKDDSSGKLLVKRFYFDNETVLKQINGQAEAASVPEFGEHQIALAK